MAMTNDLVSSTIAARQREPEGLRKMMIASGIAHVLAIVAIVVVPWLVGAQSQRKEEIMEVSLGGAPGPVSGGMTSLSGRPVQKVEPKPELPRPEPPRPPAPKPAEMVEQATKATPKPVVKQASPSTRPAPPTTGEAVRPGQARNETGSTSNETGLSTGGGGSGAANTMSNFCDPQYLGQMVSLIHRNWEQRQTVVAKPVIRFVIQRDGSLTDISVRQPSGYYALDNAAYRAVVLTRAIPPLPMCYPHPDFAVNLTFEYIR
jgi:TonB family protein